MEAIIFNLFGVLFRMIGLLILGGILVAVLTDIQRKAFDNKHTGLVSMLKVNHQLVGKDSR